MKINRINTFIWVLFLGFSFVTCDNDDDNRTPLEQLPEATQTGRSIFGALVNGEPFIETGNFFNTFYQQIDGEFFFGIQGEFVGKNPESISLRTEKKTIEENEVLNLRAIEEGQAYGECSFIGIGVSDNTGTTLTGQLTITKLDFETNIVSGTFWFDVIHPETNETFEIREGRFDTLFTQ